MKYMKEMSDQTRVVIASALSLAVIVVWGVLYRPTPPPSATNSQNGTSIAAPAAADAAAPGTVGQPALSRV